MFALSTPDHLLAKLRWEVSGFKRAEGRKNEFRGHLIAAYHAMNCAITAWHMADWVWMHLDEGSQRDLAAVLGLGKADLASFEAKIRADSRAINCCRDIATGSKHMKLNRKGSDPEVDAEVVWAFAPADVEMAGVDDPIGRYSSHLIVHDSLGARPAQEVFHEAFSYWESFLVRRGLTEDRFAG